jgi:hypothetical protein
MKIIANSYFLRNLRYLDFFTMDLGHTKRIPQTEKLRKVDEFELKYRNLYGNNLLKFGNIANKVIFYDDVKLNKYSLIVFKDDDIYELEWEENDLKDIKNFILETMRKIDQADENETELENVNKKQIEEYSQVFDVWESDDIKNGKKKYLIDQTLTKAEYREKMREFLDSKKKMNEQTKNKQL